MEKQGIYRDEALDIGALADLKVDVRQILRYLEEDEDEEKEEEDL